MSLTAEPKPTTNQTDANRRGNWIANVACVMSVVAAIGYGRLFYGGQSDSFLLITLIGVLIGSFWPSSFYRSAWGTAAAFSGAAGVPLARAFC